MNPSTGQTYALDTYVDLSAARADLLMGGELVPVSMTEVPYLQSMPQDHRENELRSRTRMTFRDLEKAERRLMIKKKGR